MEQKGVSYQRLKKGKYKTKKSVFSFFPLPAQIRSCEVWKMLKHEHLGSVFLHLTDFWGAAYHHTASASPSLYSPEDSRLVAHSPQTWEPEPLGCIWKPTSRCQKGEEGALQCRVALSAVGTKVKKSKTRTNTNFFYWTWGACCFLLPPSLQNPNECSHLV